MDLTELAKSKLKEVKGFIANNNYNIIEVKENYCELEGILTESSMNNFNVAHGGYIFGLADTAAGVAAMTTGKNAMTIDANINYLRPAVGNKLIAVATSIKIGKSISVFDVTIKNDEEKLIAKSTITYAYIN